MRGLQAMRSRKCRGQYGGGMSSAGQANEAGSVARRNAATYFAVHMLAARPVEALENYKAIAHVAFESSDPTDDLVLTFEGDARAFASAKRKVTYGAPFIETVKGWVAQLDEDLGADDVLVLVCEEAAAWVRDLADALIKLRSGVPADSSRHQAALRRLDAHVPEDKRAEVRRRARIIELPRTATNNDNRALLALMMGSLVEDSAGSAAVSAISESVHDWAGRALGFDTEKLVSAIASRGIVVLADPSGPAAAKAAAAQAAATAYLSALATLRGRVDLTLLADDLGPIVVEDLLANVRVTEPNAVRGIDRDLRTVLRRNRRVLIVGQPGSGKSLAMRELAGWCASDPDAPIPVPVHLPSLLPRHPDHTVTVEDLVTLAAKRGPKSGRQQVERFLARAIQCGDAILLLDGLDECRGRAAWMADQLRALIAGVPSTTAAVLATRASVEIPAAAVGLTRVDLARPHDLDATIEAVLEQCARVRVPDAELRSQWLRTRRDWLEGARDHQAGMLQVPQLALLVALIIGSTSEIEIPKKRAELLHEAVRQSVKRWEHGRFSGTQEGGWGHDLTPEMLLDGFVVLGRRLDGRDSPPLRAEALAALSDMLVDSDGWDLSGAKARELAEQVLAFWDVHVAVFVLDEDDHLISRSRVFTEVATAMWTRTCSGEDLREWAINAIRYYDSEGVVALALGLNSALVELLLELGNDKIEATLAVAAAVRSGAIELATHQVDSLVQQLSRHATDIERGVKVFPDLLTREEKPFDRLVTGWRRRGPSSWPLVEALCWLTLTANQRSLRAGALAGLALPERNAAIAQAWIALTDAKADDRPLVKDEVEVVAAVLGRDLPERGEMVKVGRVHTFSSSEMPDPGLGLVARHAVIFLQQLPEGSAEKIYRISEVVPHGEGVATRTALRRAGVDTKQWVGPSPFKGVYDAIRERGFEKRLLDDITSIGDGNVDLTKRDRWSLPALSNLIEATGYSGVGIPDFRAAFEKDDASLRRKWLKALGMAHEIDLDRAAAEAAIVRAQATADHLVPPDWWVISSQRFERENRTDPMTLEADAQGVLLECMHAASHWISGAALYVLANVEPTWDTTAFFDVDRSGWTPYRASECYLLSLLVSPEGEQLATRAADSTDPARRHALRRALRYRSDIDATGEFAARLGRDADLWVRGELDVAEPAASHWTCQFCATRNPLGEESCKKCELASRPNSRQVSKTN